MTISELLELLVSLNPKWVVHNAPRSPHQYMGRFEGLAMVMTQAYLMYPQPSLSVDEVINVINRGASANGLMFDEPVYAVESMHQAGSEVTGLLLTPNGVRLVWE
jgi:hypothetical protein